VARFLTWLRRIPKWVWAVLLVLQVLTVICFADAASTAERLLVYIPNGSEHDDLRRGHLAVVMLNRNMSSCAGAVAAITLGLAALSILRRPSNQP
jgi:hypothetical protein